MRDKNVMDHFACKFKFNNSKLALIDSVTFNKNECPKTYFVHILLNPKIKHLKEIENNKYSKVSQLRI